MRTENKFKSKLRTGTIVRKKRIELGYKSAEKFAHDHNVNRSTYQRIEAGNDLLLSTVFRLAEIFNCHPNDLI